MWQKVLLMFGSGALCGILSRYFVKRLLARGKRTKDDFFFVNFDGTLCQLCFNKRRPNLCGNKTCSFQLMRSVVKELDGAEKCINICNPIILIPDLICALIRAHQRKVHVRIIVDAEMSGPPEIINFLKAGICVKPLGNENMTMHNKFIVVDERLLIRSSLNYTFSVKGNCENMQFIRNREKVLCYNKHFHELWDDQSAFHKNLPAGRLLKERVNKS